MSASPLLKIRTISATGEYRMGDNDTRTDAKRLALLDAKRLALEQAGTYIESITQVKNFDLTKEEIRAYTAGIVEVPEQATQTTMEGDNTVVRVGVTVKIDTDTVAQQIDTLRKNESAKAELIRAKEETDRLRHELESKTRELAAVKSKFEVETVTKQRQQIIVQAFVKELMKRAFVAYLPALYLFIEAEERPASRHSALEALAQARNFTEQALTLDPSNLEAQGLMAKILADEGHYLALEGNNEAAVRKFRMLLQLKPDDAKAHQKFALALMKMGDWDRAIAELRTAISLEPEDAATHTFLGSGLHKKGDYDGAIAEFRTAIRLDPDGWGAHVGLSQAFKEVGRKEESEREFNEGMRLMANMNKKLDERNRRLEEKLQKPNSELGR